MSQFTPRRAKRFSRPNAPKARRGAIVAAGLLLAAGATAVAIGGAGSDGDAGALERTGELNAMGMPVVATPGSGTGTAEAAGVIADAAAWELGRVPLNVAVRPAWTLRNTGDRAVRLGEPHPEVLKGCCPGPAVLDNRTLEPGESTTVTFELSMHPGMDGPHELALHVPVDDGTSRREFLTLNVTGDFRS